MALVLPGLWRVPETVHHAAGLGPSLATRMRVPAAGHPRFLSIVTPLAPWVFGSASVSFAVLPSIVSDRTRGFGIAFAGLIAVLTLGVGVLVQPVARRLDRLDSSRGAVAGLLEVQRIASPDELAGLNAVFY